MTDRKRVTSKRRRTAAVAAKANLLQVARIAGVSPSTVSRILNGTARVSNDKRNAVEATIAKLDFRPNLLARGLRKGRGMTIGILTQDVESPFFTASLKGIEEGLQGSGFAPLIASGHWNAQEEAERVALLISRCVDGIILLTGFLEPKQIANFSRTLPIVVTGRGSLRGNVFSISVDNLHGGYLATRHLFELGHRRIAHLSGEKQHVDAIDRLKGYRMALEDAGIEYDRELVVNGGFEVPGGVMAMNQLIESRQNFTAVFAANDESAFGARLALYRRGIRVPDDVSMVGFDDLPVSRYATPPLTTVRQPLFEMGRHAARSLLDMLNGRTPGSHLVLDVELVVRETTRRIR